MRVRLDRAREEPFLWDTVREIPAEAVGHPDLVDLGPVAWRGRVTYAESGFVLSASCSYRQTLSCIRCLRPVEQPVEARVEMLILQREGEEELGQELELEEEDLDVLVVSGEVLDLEPLLMEQLELNVPMKTLCRPDCAGICSSCGADLSAGPCDCSPPTDPRWAALEELKTQLSGGG
jgi:uncharacterized protein